MDMWHNLTRWVAASKTSLTNHESRQQRPWLHVFKCSTGDRVIISATWKSTKLARYVTNERGLETPKNKKTKYIFHDWTFSSFSSGYRMLKANKGHRTKISSQKEKWPDTNISSWLVFWGFVFFCFFNFWQGEHQHACGFLGTLNLAVIYTQ